MEAVKRVNPKFSSPEKIFFLLILYLYMRWWMFPKYTDNPFMMYVNQTMLYILYSMYVHYIWIKLEEKIINSGKKYKNNCWKVPRELQKKKFEEMWPMKEGKYTHWVTSIFLRLLQWEQSPVFLVQDD